MALDEVPARCNEHCGIEMGKSRRLPLMITRSCDSEMLGSNVLRDLRASLMKTAPPIERPKTMPINCAVKICQHSALKLLLGYPGSLVALNLPSIMKLQINSQFQEQLMCLQKEESS